MTWVDVVFGAALVVLLVLDGAVACAWFDRSNQDEQP